MDGFVEGGTQHLQGAFRTIAEVSAAAIFVCSGDRVLVYANGAGQRLLEDGTCLLRGADRRLRSAVPSLERRFATTFTRCRDGGAGEDDEMPASGRDGGGSAGRDGTGPAGRDGTGPDGAAAGRPLICSLEDMRPGIVPLVAHFHRVPGDGGQVVIHVPRARVAANDPAVIAQLIAAYRLTAAEARLACVMLSGITNTQGMADALDRSPWTVQAQVKSLFRKLGVGSKTDATARMAAEVLPLGGW